jgi:hypothetical protein
METVSRRHLRRSTPYRSFPQSEVASRICMNVDTSPSAQDDCRQSWSDQWGLLSRRAADPAPSTSSWRAPPGSGLPCLALGQARKSSRHILQRRGVVVLERRSSIGAARSRKVSNQSSPLLITRARPSSPSITATRSPIGPGVGGASAWWCTGADRRRSVVTESCGIHRADVR